MAAMNDNDYSTAATVPEILPLNWEMSRPVKLNIGITPIDEFGLPVNRRGLVANMPTKPEHFAGFADEVAATVRATILHILEGKP